MRNHPAVRTKAKARLLLLTLCVCPALLRSQEAVPPPASEIAATRPCTANPVLAYSPGKKAKKLKHPPQTRAIGFVYNPKRKK